MFTRIAIVFATLALAFGAVACGGQSDQSAQPDKYVGTWVQKPVGTQEPPYIPRIVVKQLGGRYAFTDPSGKTPAIVSDPDASGKQTLRVITLGDQTLASRDGDALKLPSGSLTFKITVNGDTMTWMTAHVNTPFTFTRETASTSSSPTTPTSPTPMPTVTTSLGQSVRSGDLELSVTGTSSVQKTGGMVEGHYFVANVTLTNIGTQSLTTDTKDQVAYSMNNEKFTSSSMVSSGALFGRTLNPGESASGQIAWEVPEGTIISRLELQYSPSSDVVRVNII